MGGGAPTCAVGDHVYINKRRNYSGTVRFVGATQFKEGDWVGIELDRPKGHHDGEVAGTRYFGPCAPNHGIFVRPNTVSPYEAEAGAAIAIQSASRRRLGKRRVSAEHAATSPSTHTHDLRMYHDDPVLQSTLLLLFLITSATTMFTPAGCSLCFFCRYCCCLA